MSIHQHRGPRRRKPLGVSGEAVGDRLARRQANLSKTIIEASLHRQYQKEKVINEGPDFM